MADQPLGERVAKLEAIVPEVRDDLHDLREMLRNELSDLKGMLSERLEDHEKRISALERWRHWVLGAAAAVGVAADAFWRWLSAGRQGG
ncbi:MAG TPA: hypothetical protein VIK75_04280 [Calditerricola sp.]